MLPMGQGGMCNSEIVQSCNFGHMYHMIMCYFQTLQAAFVFALKVLLPVAQYPVPVQLMSEFVPPFCVLTSPSH
jgi:hypothetical protein